MKNTYEAIDNVGRNEAETYNRMEANLAGNIALAEKRYEVIGGQSYREFMNKKINLYNTCALRVSYALNYSTHPIKNMKKQVVGKGYKGKDNHTYTYYLGVPDIVELLSKIGKSYRGINQPTIK